MTTLPLASSRERERPFEAHRLKADRRASIVRAARSKLERSGSCGFRQASLSVTKVVHYYSAHAVCESYRLQDRRLPTTGQLFAWSHAGEEGECVISAVNVIRGGCQQLSHLLGAQDIFSWVLYGLDPTATASQGSEDCSPRLQARGLLASISWRRWRYTD
jgi:hypothetical protein